MEKVRYAMIGFGGIAENRIAKEGFACDKSRFPVSPEKYVLAGAFDQNTSRKAAAETLGLKWYNSLEDLLADPSIDAVYVATNNASHAPLALRVMEAGKHVFVEKPLATTAEDVEKLFAAAKERNLSLAVDHMMVANRLNEMAREMVKAGKLGTVNDGCFHMEFLYGSTPEEAATWRCSLASELGGPIGDVASHCFYMAEFMLDSPITELAACYLPKTLSIAVEDGAYIKFKTASGFSGSVKVAFSESRGGLGGTLSNLGFELYGTEAALRGFGTLFQLSGHSDEPVPIWLMYDRFTEQEKITLSPDEVQNIYQTVIARHAESILTGKPHLPEDGLRNVRQCLAAHESAQNGGRWISIKE